jgi:hypothetical protein
MVLGVLSVVCLPFVLATRSPIAWWFLPLIFGSLAWRLGNRDLQRMSDGLMDPDGEMLTSTGRLCGKIVTILTALALLVYPLARFLLAWLALKHW